MNRVKLKKKAKALLKNNIWTYWQAMLLVFLIISVGDILLVLINQPSFAFVFGLFMAPLAIGFQRYWLNFVRGKDLSFKLLFSPYTNIVAIVLVHILAPLFTGLWTLLFIIPGVIASFSYIQTPLVSADLGNKDPLFTIKRSKDLMKGHKWEYFILCLSFGGWIITGLFTLGISFIWVAPYIQTTLTLYYEQLAENFKA